MKHVQIISFRENHSEIFFYWKSKIIKKKKERKNKEKLVNKQNNTHINTITSANLRKFWFPDLTAAS